MQTEQLQWLWPGRIPLGKVTLLAGDPGLGKSFITCDVAARVSQGMPWPDLADASNLAGNVIVLNSEDAAADTVKPRLEKAGADVGRIYFVDGMSAFHAESGEEMTRGFSLQHDMPALESMLDTLPDVRLVTIDPISAYCGGVDSHKNTDVRAMLSPLAAMAARRKVAVVVVTHLNKGGNGGSAVYRCTGSLAFAAAARAVWAVTKDTDNPSRRLLLPMKMNLSPDLSGLAYAITDGVVCWEREPVTMTADEAFGRDAAANLNSDDQDEREMAGAWLTELLFQAPTTAKEVFNEGRKAGFSDRSIRKAAARLGVKTRREGFGKGSQVFWELPAPAPAIPDF